VHSDLRRLRRARLGFDVEFHVVAGDLGDAHVRDVWTLRTCEAAVELAVTLEFDGKPEDPVPPAFATDLGQKQDAAIKSGLPG
jgi:hypothetical protein